jgi:siroheme synthase
MNMIAPTRRRLVVVGNGMAGIRAREEILDRAPQAFTITVFDAEPHGAYNRILLSPVLAGEKAFEAIVTNDHAWYQRNGIELIAGAAVTAIDRKDRVVTDRVTAVAESDYAPSVTGTRLKVTGLPSEAAIAPMIGRPVPNAERGRLLAGRPFDRAALEEPLVCACFGVSRDAVRHAIVTHGLRDVGAIGAHLRAGAHVVRLNGDDPFVFGRGGEKLDTLRQAGIPVEVVPGVTAACAAATSLRIPLTPRDVARAALRDRPWQQRRHAPGHDWAALVAGAGVEGPTTVIIGARDHRRSGGNGPGTGDRGGEGDG